MQSSRYVPICTNGLEELTAPISSKEDCGCRFIQNVDTYLPDYTVSHTGRHNLSLHIWNNSLLHSTYHAVLCSTTLPVKEFTICICLWICAEVPPFTAILTLYQYIKHKYYILKYSPPPFQSEQIVEFTFDSTEKFHTWKSLVGGIWSSTALTIMITFFYDVMPWSLVPPFSGVEKALKMKAAGSSKMLVPVYQVT